MRAIHAQGRLKLGLDQKGPISGLSDAARSRDPADRPVELAGRAPVEATLRDVAQATGPADGQKKTSSPVSYEWRRAKCPSEAGVAWLATLRNGSFGSGAGEFRAGLDTSQRSCGLSESRAGQPPGRDLHPRAGIQAAALVQVRTL